MRPRRMSFRCLAFCVGWMLVGGGVARGQNEGLPDLDEAIVKKIDAQSLKQLEGVAALIESAMAKGLDEENTAFAKKMLGGILSQRGQAIVARLRQGGISPVQLQQLRRDALGSLEKAVANDPSLGEAHLNIAVLNLIPGGNADRARQAASAAIENLKEDPGKKSEAYLIRSELQQDDAARLADLDAAIEADPENVRAMGLRAVFRLQSGETDGGIADLKRLLEKDPTNTQVAATAAQALMQANRTAEADTILSEAIQSNQNAQLYLLRSQLRRADGREDEALADVDRALAVEPNNLLALLIRAEYRYLKEDLAGAKADIDAALKQRPGEPSGIIIRSMIAAREERYTDAINDMNLLLQKNPGNLQWSLQLASYYQLDKRPRKAIEIATAILEQDPSIWQALRLRGDSHLSINQHAEAIADYEAALKIPVAGSAEEDADMAAGEEGEAGSQQGVKMSKEARSGLANNLAWVLATSPKDEVRDAARALEYGEQAATLTEFKEPHILSTLAAAYAEGGDFAKAIEWAEKAVELGKSEGHEQLEQLENELESYRAGKPWREEQKTEENVVPILAPDQVIDT